MSNRRCDICHGLYCRSLFGAIVTVLAIFLTPLWGPAIGHYGPDWLTTPGKYTWAASTFLAISLVLFLVLALAAFGCHAYDCDKTADEHTTGQCKYRPAGRPDESPQEKCRILARRPCRNQGFVI